MCASPHEERGNGTRGSESSSRSLPRYSSLTCSIQAMGSACVAIGIINWRLYDEANDS
jgi:hypothetical protein